MILEDAAFFVGWWSGRLDSQQAAVAAERQLQGLFALANKCKCLVQLREGGRCQQGERRQALGAEERAAAVQVHTQVERIVALVPQKVGEVIHATIADDANSLGTALTQIEAINGANISLEFTQKQAAAKLRDSRIFSP